MSSSEQRGDSPAKRPLHGRVALVTGAGRGIGRAAARCLAASGATVMAVSRTRSELDALRGEIGGASLPCSLAEPQSCARAVEETLRLYGRIDLLVHSAGIGSAGERAIWEQDPARWRQAMAVNLDAPFLLTRLALPHMIAAGYGRIVMVCSLASRGHGVKPSMSAYAVSKHGLLGLMSAVAVEVAPFGITCNAILPGSVRTRTAELKVAEEARLAGTTIQEAWQARERGTAAGRLVTPEECAAAIAFLAQESASGINGQALEVSL